MKPDVGDFLNQAADTLSTEILPLLEDEYRAGTVSIIALMLKLAAEEYDRAAEIRVTENRAMRELFAEAADGLPDAELALRLRDASQQRDDDLRVRALDETNDALRRLLIELHELVETRNDATSTRICEAISALLQRAAELRILTFPTP